MKKAILLFAVLFTFSAVTIAQTTDDSQRSLTPLNQQQKEQMNEKLGHYYTMLSVTSSQEQKLDEIAEKYYKYYLKYKDDQTTKAELQDFQQFLLDKALSEAKPVLTNEQWRSVSEVVKARKDKLERN